MGMDRTIRCEAFIRIPIQIKKYEEEESGCPDHPSSTISVYCPNCGKESGTYTVEKERNKWLMDIIGEDHEDMLSHHFDKTTMYLFSNHYGTESSIDTSVDVLTPITDLLIKQKTTNFAAFYAKQIKLLSEVIGKPIEVEFGFLHEYH